jgi:hypothetical protein
MQSISASSRPGRRRSSSDRRGERTGSLAVALAGRIAMVIFGVASITDYPLRVPSLACLGAIGALWLKSGQIRPAPAPAEANI